MAENLPHLAENINLQIQEDFQVPNRIIPQNPHQNLMVRLLNINDKIKLDNSERKMTVQL